MLLIFIAQSFSCTVGLHCKYIIQKKMENYSNSSNDTDPCAVESPGLYIQIIGTVVFVVVWPFIVLDMKWFPLGRLAAALVGAMLMVLFQVVTQDDVYVVEGRVGNLPVNRDDGVVILL